MQSEGKVNSCSLGCKRGVCGGWQQSPALSRLCLGQRGHGRLTRQSTGRLIWYGKRSALTGPGEPCPQHLVSGGLIADTGSRRGGCRGEA